MHSQYFDLLPVAGEEHREVATQVLVAFNPICSAHRDTWSALHICFLFRVWIKGNSTT